MRRSIRGSDWTIVGHFDQGQAQQCAVYADVDSLMSTFGRNTYTSVSVRLQSPADFDAFRAAVKANPTLHLEAKREREVDGGRIQAAERAAELRQLLRRHDHGDRRHAGRA